MPIDGVTIGRRGLRALHASLLTNAPDHAVVVLQDTGFAVGEDVYHAFCAWLPVSTGINKPEEIDAGRLGPVLSRFFESSGWGTVTIEPLGGGALAVDSTDWSEAEPGSAQAPMCFLSAGMLAGFLGKLSGEPVGVMEVECRSRGDARCRFLSALPERLQAVYEAMTQGRSYADALAATE